MKYRVQWTLEVEADTPQKALDGLALVLAGGVVAGGRPLRVEVYEAEGDGKWSAPVWIAP